MDVNIFKIDINILKIDIAEEKKDLVTDMTHLIHTIRTPFSYHHVQTCSIDYDIIICTYRHNQGERAYHTLDAQGVHV